MENWSNNNDHPALTYQDDVLYQDHDPDHYHLEMVDWLLQVFEGESMKQVKQRYGVQCLYQYLRAKNLIRIESHKDRNLTSAQKLPKKENLGIGT